MSRYELIIAIRYLWAARKRAHTAFLSLISTLGLAVGVATLLISLALLSGLQGQIKQRLIAASPRLLLEPAGSNTIENPDAVTDAARAAGLTDIHPVITGIAWGSDPKGGRGEPARIRSFDESSVPKAESSFGRNWSYPDRSDSIYVTRGFAASIGLSLGETVMIVAPRTKLTPFGPVPVWRKYTLTRLVAAGSDEKSADAYIPFREASRLFGTGDKPTAIEIFGGPAEGVESIQSDLAARFPDLLVKTWKEINRPLFLALRLEKVVMFATISLIILVAALNLVSSLSMLIVEKRPQVGILRTLGASERGILSIFLGVGLLIGLLGTGLGNVIGLGVSWAADKYHWVPLPGDVYYLSHIPFQIDPGDVLGVNLIAIVLSVLATWYPARVASRLDPIAAIREE